MQLSLAGWWQLSPLTDLSIPQTDIDFPGRISRGLPAELSEVQIAEQEWHLMHDIEVDQTMLNLAAVDLVLESVTQYAEVRVNGVAVFDCDGSQYRYQKNILPYLQLGKNRFEILFLQPDEDYLVEPEETVCHLAYQTMARDPSAGVGIGQTPFLKLIKHVRLLQLTIEQIWHHGGSCELKVNAYYKTLKTGLVAAQVQYDAVSYTVPLDVRHDHLSALFQVDAPRVGYISSLTLRLDGYHVEFYVQLSPSQSVQHYHFYSED